MRLILGCVILCLCTYIGYFLSQKYVKRKEFYQDFISFNNKMKNEVSFFQNTIDNIIKKSENDGDFYKYLLNKKNINVCDYKCEYLTTEENKYVKNYVKELGTTDKDSQLKYFDIVDDDISKIYEKVESDEKKYKVLFLKLGFLFGLIILIVLL